MLNIIVLIAYISFFNIVYIGKFGNHDSLSNLSSLGNHSNKSRAEITTEVPLLSNNKAFRSKYCNFKCDCFFSHSVKNDNICVPIWIKPLGL
jgi:hypothetical protein